MNSRWTLPAGALALALTAAQAVLSQTASATTSTTRRPRLSRAPGASVAPTPPRASAASAPATSATVTWNPPEHQRRQGPQQALHAHHPRADAGRPAGQGPAGRAAEPSREGVRVAQGSERSHRVPLGSGRGRCARTRRRSTACSSGAPGPTSARPRSRAWSRSADQRPTSWPGRLGLVGPRCV